MRLLLVERLAGPLRTKGGERVLGVKLDGDPDFRGPATSKTRATVDTLVTSIKHGGGANYKHAMFCSLFSNGTRSFEAAGPRKSESPSFFTPSTRSPPFVRNGPARRSASNKSSVTS